MNLIGQYAKAISAFFMALGTWGATALAVGANGEPAAIDGAEWFGLCLVVATTVTVWAVPNTPKRRR